MLTAICGLFNVSFAQKKDSSLVYLYYTNSFGERPTFIVRFNDKEVIRLYKKARVIYKIYSAGNVNISAFYTVRNEKQNESSVTLNIQPGKIYYVKLDNAYLKLKSVDESTGEKEFNDSKLAQIQNLEEDLLNPVASKPVVAQNSNNVPVAAAQRSTNQSSTKNDSDKSKAAPVKIAETAGKTFIPSLRFIKPIPSIISGTAVWDNKNAASLHAKDYKISSWGFGVGVDVRVKKNLRLFFDGTSYDFNQELVPEGGTGHCIIGMGSDISLPKGVKYKTSTVSMRLGIKYVYEKSTKVQPWMGAAYGVNVWNAKYVTWNEKEIYGKANGTTMRPVILAGIDFKYKNMLSFTLFFEAISPVAKYTMENLFGAGNYNKGDATTYPTPRIGFSIGGF